MLCCRDSKPNATLRRKRRAWHVGTAPALTRSSFQLCDFHHTDPNPSPLRLLHPDNRRYSLSTSHIHVTRPNNWNHLSHYHGLARLPLERHQQRPEREDQVQVLSRMVHMNSCVSCFARADCLRQFKHALSARGQGDGPAHLPVPQLPVAHCCRTNLHLPQRSHGQLDRNRWCRHRCRLRPNSTPQPRAHPFEPRSFYYSYPVLRETATTHDAEEEKPYSSRVRCVTQRLA